MTKVIAESGVFIGIDSGPSWIAACYPQIQRKKILPHWDPSYLRASFTPMHRFHPELHWYDNFTYYNQTSEDAGVTFSYLKL